MEGVNAFIYVNELHVRIINYRCFIVFSEHCSNPVHVECDTLYRRQRVLILCENLPAILFCMNLPGINVFFVPFTMLSINCRNEFK